MVYFWLNSWNSFLMDLKLGFLFLYVMKVLDIYLSIDSLAATMANVMVLKFSYVQCEKRRIMLWLLKATAWQNNKYTRQTESGDRSIDRNIEIDKKIERIYLDKL